MQFPKTLAVDGTDSPIDSIRLTKDDPDGDVLAIFDCDQHPFINRAFAEEISRRYNAFPALLAAARNFLQQWENGAPTRVMGSAALHDAIEAASWDDPPPLPVQNDPDDAAALVAAGEAFLLAYHRGEETPRNRLFSAAIYAAKQSPVAFGGYLLTMLKDAALIFSTAAGQDAQPWPQIFDAIRNLDPEWSPPALDAKEGTP